MILVFRLFSPGRDPRDATGAFLRGGRWNSPGTAVLYTASSLSLACLEVLVHIRNPDNFPSFSYSQLAIREDKVEPWESDNPAISSERRKAIFESEVLSREEGDIWIRERQRAPTSHRVYQPGDDPQAESYVFASPLPVRQVPSVVVPLEYNYLIDPEEKLFATNGRNLDHSD